MLCSARLSAAVRESAGMGLEHKEPQSLSEAPEINFCHQIFRSPAFFALAKCQTEKHEGEDEHVVRVPRIFRG